MNKFLLTNNSTRGNPDAFGPGCTPGFILGNSPALDFAKIAQDNYFRAQKANCKKCKLRQRASFWDKLRQAIEKAVFITCTVSLVLDAILLIAIALDMLSR